jgi:alkanesulfonate monooxygenase SsuD/methylene tetrahydromethanopterin reductase-like flavin-dependent oxidoreductase (luciferase family)
MKVDLYLYRPALDEIPGRGRQAEQGGFDGLFVAESTGDPFQNLAVASQHTSQVTLGTSVALAFPRSPMLTAVFRHGNCNGPRTDATSSASGPKYAAT